MAVVAHKRQTFDSHLPMKGKYRPEIDGLRAFAVLAVILNHFNKDILPSGYLGVDMFFVISGYVITSSLARRESKGFLDFIARFYEGRIKRLVLPLAVLVLMTSVLICLFNPDPQLALRTGIASLIGVSNLYLLRQSTDYFAQPTKLNPFTHTWSLGVEEQFYLFFPLLVWFSGFGRRTPKGATNLVYMHLVLAICSLIAFVYLHRTNQPAAYFLMPTRFWEMASGCLVFAGLHKRVKLSQLLERVPSLPVIVAMGGVMFSPPTAAVPATISIVLLSAVLIACLKEDTVGFHILTLDKVRYIGLISYSLYLWHWVVLAISQWSIGVSWWSAPFQAALMLVLAMASYHLVENPFRRRAWGGSLVITTGFFVLVATSLGVLGVSASRGFLFRVGGLLLPDAAIVDTGIVQARIQCHMPGNIENAIADCLGGVHGDYPSIFIIGDSHASNHFPSIEEAVMSLPVVPRVRVLIDPGLIDWLQGVGTCGSDMHCVEDSWARHRNFFLENMRQGDLVIFSWFRGRVTVPSSRLPREVDKGKRDILRNRLRVVASVVQAAGGRIVLVDDTPMTCEPEINFRHFVLRLGQVERCSIPEEVSLHDRSGLTEVYMDLAAANRDAIFYFDPHPALCAEGKCDIFDRRQGSHSGRVLYGDGIGHFRSDFPSPLSREWKAFLARVLVLQY